MPKPVYQPNMPARARCLAVVITVALLAGCRSDPLPTPRLPTPTQPAHAATLETSILLAAPTAENAVAPPATASGASLAPTATWAPPLALPEVAVSPTPLATPGPGPVSFALQPWSLEDSLAALETLEAFARASNLAAGASANQGFVDAQIPIQLAAHEAQLRFPQSELEGELRWRSALADALTGNPASDAWVLGQLAAELNAAGGGPAELPALAEAHGFRVAQIYPAANLFGDGRPAHAVWLTTRWGRADGLFLAASEPAPGTWQFDLVRSHWDFDGGEDWLYAAADHTLDGLPELVLEIGSRAGGQCAANLEIYQWRDGHFANLASRPGNPYGLAMPACDAEWQYVSAEAGPAAIEVRPDWSSSQGAALVQRYSWDTLGYIWTATTLPPPDDPANPAAAWSSYAWETGQYNALAERLAAIRDAWPTQPEARWLGASYPDYVRFQLALTYAFRGQPEAARAELARLAAQPENQLSPAVPTAAAAYLAAYTTGADLYRACAAALAVMDTALAAQPLNPAMGAEARYLAAWGYAPAGAEADLCSLRAALQHYLSFWSGGDATLAANRLRQIGVPVLASQLADLDADSRADWVLVLGPATSHSPGEAWVLLNQPGGPVAVPVLPWEARYVQPHPTGDERPPTIDLVNVPGGDRPLVAVQLGSQTHLFRLYTAGEAARVVSVVPTHLPRGQGYSLARTADSLSLVVSQPLRGCPRCTAGYEWDAARQAFAWRQSSRSRLTALAPVLAAEAMLFDAGQPGRARPLYAAALESSDTQLRPRVLYGLALAAELQGDTALAVSVYWQLWRDHPGSAFALLAEQKLAPRP